MKTMKTLKQSLIVLALMVGAISLLSFMPVAGAQAWLTADDNITGGGTDLRQTIVGFIKYALGFLGLIAVIMIMYGGFTYVISGGDDEKTGDAKKMIMYALIGLVIIMLAFVLVNGVLGAMTSGTGGTQ